MPIQLKEHQKGWVGWLFLFRRHLRHMFSTEQYYCSNWNESCNLTRTNKQNRQNVYLKDMYFKALYSCKFEMYLICICIEENCDDASIKDNWAEMAQASLICLPGNPDDAHIQLNTNRHKIFLGSL